jgi:hypothetical protein
MEKRDDNANDTSEKLECPESLCTKRSKKQKENRKWEIPFTGKRRRKIPMVQRIRKAMKPRVSSSCELSISLELEDDDRWGWGGVGWETK